MGLYLLIWGEASNVRFMPECLCYIFHNVSIILGFLCMLSLWELYAEIFNLFITISIICVDGIWTPWSLGWKCQHCHWWKYKAFLRWGWWGFPAEGYNTPLPCNWQGMLWDDRRTHQVWGAYLLDLRILLVIFQEAKKCRNGKAPHSAWCNYDDLNEYFWFVWIHKKFLNWGSLLFVAVISWFLYIALLLLAFRSSDCFSLGWPMRDDGDFFKSTRDLAKVVINPEVYSSFLFEIFNFVD